MLFCTLSFTQPYLHELPPYCCMLKLSGDLTLLGLRHLIHSALHSEGGRIRAAFLRWYSARLEQLLLGFRLSLFVPWVKRAGFSWGFLCVFVSIGGVGLPTPLATSLGWMRLKQNLGHSLLWHSAFWDSPAILPLLSTSQSLLRVVFLYSDQSF